MNHKALMRALEGGAENADSLRETLAEWQTADLADLVGELDDESAARLFAALTDSDAAMVISELDLADQERLFSILGPARTSDILSDMAHDDVVDIIGELPTERADHFLGLLDKDDAADIEQLLEFAPHTAGGIMTKEFVAISEDWKVPGAIDFLRNIAPSTETVYYLYVVDSAGRLSGVVSLRELITAAPDSRIGDVMRSGARVISVHESTDQEHVARLIAKYDFLALPVVDDDGVLVGIVTVDDIIDVLEEEVTEDMYRLGGASVEPKERYQDRRLGLSDALRLRLPWLLITLLGGVISSRVISAFSWTLDTVLSLAFFMPLIAGMGGNIGTQSSTITVRGLATGDLDLGNVWKSIWREFRIGITAGIISGSLVGLIAWVWQRSPALGLVVGTAMVANMTTAASVGTLVPMLFKRFGVDPAVASAPFISTSIDIIGLWIYFGLTTVLIRAFGLL